MGNPFMIWIGTVAISRVQAEYHTQKDCARSLL
jgi:hypothetical protein